MDIDLNILRMLEREKEISFDVLVEPLAAVGLDLEDVDLSSAGRRRVLRIAVDRDGGVSLDDVADATREVSKVLDDSEVMGEQPYTLEVGSPGVDRPLTHPRHWRRNHDRLVDVRLADGARLTGRIAASDDATATLLVDGEEQQVPLADVERARIQIEFKRKDG